MECLNFQIQINISGSFCLDGGTPAVPDTRITEEGDTRITEEGDTRITE